MSIDADPQQQEAASPQVLVVRSFLRYASSLHTFSSRGALAFAMLVGAVLSGCAQATRFGADTWREEILLHDGQKIIAERSQTYGGRHEIGQALPVKEHTIRFSLPNSSRVFGWTSEYGAELGRTNFELLALHIQGNTPYLITRPNLCLAYNKWGRPNPPYIVFRSDGTAWRQVPMEEVPSEFKSINLVVSTSRVTEIAEVSRSAGYMPFEAVARLNENLRAPELKSILRHPAKGGLAECEVLIQYKCGWGSPGELNRAYFERVCK